MVHNVMSTAVISVDPEMTWQEAAALLREANVSGAPVVDKDGVLVGILSEKDLFRGLFPNYREWSETPNGFHDFEDMERDAAAVTRGRKVRDVMSHKLITTRPDAPILQIGALMAVSGIHHVPVVEGGKVIGMVGRGDIYRSILDRHLK